MIRIEMNTGEYCLPGSYVPAPHNIADHSILHSSALLTLPDVCRAANSALL